MRRQGTSPSHTVTAPIRDSSILATPSPLFASAECSEFIENINRRDFDKLGDVWMIFGLIFR
jgi:hypothetical protein